MRQKRLLFRIAPNGKRGFVLDGRPRRGRRRGPVGVEAYRASFQAIRGGVDTDARYRQWRPERCEPR